MKTFKILCLMVVGILPLQAQVSYFTGTVKNQEGKACHKAPVCGNYSNFLEIDTDEINSCPDGHHPHAIDLGLPSGTKWACCNVGAEKPEDDGGYYAWGETGEKEEYTWVTYQNAYMDDNLMDDNGRKGNWDADNNTGWWHLMDLGTIGGTKYDVAYMKDAAWRMPSYEQIKELVNSCVCTEIKQDDATVGVCFTGPNGNHIYLPGSGFRKDHEVYERGSGYYWSDTLLPEYGNVGMSLYYFHDYVIWRMMYQRFCGFPVRAVLNETSSIKPPTSTSNTNDNSIYNIYGIKVADNAADMNTLPPGIYILNGRKYVR